MSKLTKNQKSVADKVEAGKAYTLKEAAELVKEITTTKFDASLDISVAVFNVTGTGAAETSATYSNFKY